MGEIGKWQSGATPSRLCKEYYGGNIPWLKTGDLNDGYIYDISESITDKALSETSVKLNPTGSVLIAMYGATIGKIGILTFPATTNQACCACVEYNGIAPLYLFYFLLSHRDEFLKQGGGGAQLNISKEIIVETLLPIPPIAEQQRIVREIERWFAVIDKLETSAEDLKVSIQQTKSRILDLALSGKLVPQDPDDEPAIELLKRVNPDFKPCDSSHYPNLPKGWSLARMGDLSNIISGVSYAKTDIRPNGIRILRSGNIQDGKIVLFEDDIFIDNAYYKDINTVKVGDIILVASTGSSTLIGKTGYAYKSYQGTQIGAFLRIIRPKFLDIGLYLNMIFLSDYYREYIRALAKGTNINNVKNVHIEQFIIPIPPFKEQQRMVNAIVNIWKSLDSITAEL